MPDILRSERAEKQYKQMPKPRKPTSKPKAPAKKVSAVDDGPVTTPE